MGYPPTRDSTLHYPPRRSEDGSGDSVGEWTEITQDTLTNLGVTIGGTGDVSMDYVSGAWETDWTGNTLGTGDLSGTTDTWAAEAFIPLADLIPDHDWTTHGIAFRLEVVSFSTTGNDTGFMCQVRDTRGSSSNATGRGINDNSTTQRRVVVPGGSQVTTDSGDMGGPDADVVYVEFHAEWDTARLRSAAAAFDASFNHTGSGHDASGSGVGSDIDDHDIRIGPIRQSGGAATTEVHRWRVYYATYPLKGWGSS